MIRGLDPRRRIPSVDRLLASAPFEDLLQSEPRGLIVAAIQQVQAEVRTVLSAGGPTGDEITDPAWYAERTRSSIDRIRRPSLRPVINASGVVLHTNLGRAPLADVARAAIDRVAAGYSNLEFDLEHGTRGSRYAHCTELLVRLTGAEAVLVVNNNAAALVLALNTLAFEREAIISRGELVEIGGSFRVPDIMARSGARMREVGSTNRTHPEDYRAAIDASTALILKVHQSNFRIEGFTAEVPVAELEPIARTHGILLLNDLGSGLMVPSSSLGLPFEPTAADAVREGADVVTMSGDKVLGGPQAGIVLGRRDVIERMRRNPLCRAFRVDKLTLAGLEATLGLYLDPDRAIREIPVLRMLSDSASAIAARAESLAAALSAIGVAAATEDGRSTVGGGAFPGVELPGRVVTVAVDGLSAVCLDQQLRDANPPVVGRIVDDRVLLDPRTLLPGEADQIVAVIRQIAG
jgi:L-seryl-tRNA(Ser) seleniumtransferase